MRICGTTKAGVRRRFIAVRTDIRLEEKHRVSEVPQRLQQHSTHISSRDEMIRLRTEMN